MRARSLILMVALCLVLPGLVVHAAPPNLLHRATFIADTKDWWGCRFNCDIGAQWISDHEVFHAKFLGHYDPERMGIEQHLTRVACIWNTRSRQDARSQPLTRALDELDPECVDDESISPDGRWFVWSYRWSACLLVDVRTGKCHAYPQDDDGCYRHVRWMADSRRWCEFFRFNGRVHHLVLHDVREPKLSRQLPIGSQAELLGDVECIGSEHRALACRETWRSKGYEPLLEIVSLSLHGDVAPRRIALARVPGGMDYYGYALSPDGSRIAWFVNARAPSGNMVAEVWVTDLHGTAQHRLAVMTGANYDYRGDGHLQWLPGGRKLGFVWRDKLYTVPVPL